MKIKMSSLRHVVALALVLGFVSNLRAAGLERFGSVPGGKVRIEGTSTVHDWQVESPLIGGYLEAGANFPTEPGQVLKPGKADAKVEVFIPVSSLKSVTEDGKPHSDRMDEIMYEKLNEPVSRRILYRLNELTLKQAPSSTNMPYVFDAKGELIVAGITNRISMPVNVTPLGNRKLRIAGNTNVKMTDFSIKPPVLIGILSTGDEVKVSFDWMVGPRPAPVAK